MTAIRRCAVYTRKSSEEGLEQDFNSLHAQREACEAFIRSQRGEGWRLVETAYDDGGLSAATRRLLSRQGPAPVRRHRTLSPGTVLIREWHGIGHQVTIIEKGVLFRGERYRSLSEVARLITSARWSGPRFFGVKA